MMNVKTLIELLEGLDPEIPVVVRVSTYNDEPIDDGDILEVRDERSILVEFQKATIIADVPED
jgi:hypothetical protein